MTDLSAMDGALRARVDEPTWRGWWRAAGPSLTHCVTAPLIDGVDPSESAPSGVDEATLEAVRLCRGDSAVVRAELNTMTPTRGVMASIGADAFSGACAVRVVAADVPGEGGRVLPVPGVELSAFAVQDWVDSVLRLFPPDTVVPVPDDVDREVELPTEVALLLGRAVGEGDDKVVEQLCRQAGLEWVPVIVEALAEDIRANATMTLEVAGSGHTVVRRWLQCAYGWVEIGLTPTTTTHRLVDRDAIARTLTDDLAGAFDFALAVAGDSHG